MPLTIALITDIHHGKDKETRKGSVALPLFKKFKEWITKEKPDLLVDLGDRINDSDYDTDLKLLKDVAKEFKEIKCPTHHLLGNHDLDYLSRQDNEKVLNKSCQSHSINIKGSTLIFWNVNSKIILGEDINLPSSDLEWLEQTLKKAEAPAIIFTHIPLDNGSMIGNYYFEEKYARYAHYQPEDAQKARNIIEKSKKVILCVNGHAHWHKNNVINGIHYVTVPSLTETFLSPPDAQEAWALLTVSETLNIEIFGKNRTNFTLPTG